MYKCGNCGNEFLLPVKIIIPLSDPSRMLVQGKYPTTHEEASKEPHVSRIEYRCPKCNNEVHEDRKHPFNKEYAEHQWRCILLNETCKNNANCRECFIGKRAKNNSLSQTIIKEKE